MTIKKELFLVEGKSAASTLQQHLHKPSQKVHAMQGKLINASKVSAARVMASPVCKRLFEELACGTGEQCDPALLPYSRIIILTDPDVDGMHARALALRLFDSYLHPLLLQEKVFVILPPLFRVSGGANAVNSYAWSEQELESLTEKYANQSVKPDITRFKGIAQFTREECERLFLKVETRRQLLVTNT